MTETITIDGEGLLAWERAQRRARLQQAQQKHSALELDIARLFAMAASLRSRGYGQFAQQAHQLATEMSGEIGEGT